MTYLTIVFHPLGPAWLIFLGILFVGLIFIWKEWQRPIKFKWMRVFAQAIVIIAMLGFALHPADETDVSTDSYLLLTKNYNKSIADSLTKNDKTLKILRTKDADNFHGAKTLENWHALSSSVYSIKFVLGEGIPGPVLDIIPVKSYKFFPAGNPDGVIFLLLNSFYSNRQNTLQGIFSSHQKKKSTLKLEGPGGVEDSLQIIDSPEQKFSLHFTPKEPGKFLYHLSVFDTNKKISTEILPLEILPEKKLNVLILQQYPTAEIRYLKNFLSDHHHSLILRYRISQNNFSYEYANRSNLKTDLLTTTLLNSFDLVIADNQTLDHLTSPEKNSLSQSVNQGLGLLITHNTNAIHSSNYSQLTFDTAPPDSVTVKLISGENITLPALKLKSYDPSFQKIIATKSGRPLSGSIAQGNGKIGYQLLQETFSLQLKGKGAAYTTLWSSLLEAVAREKRNAFKIEIDQFPRQMDGPIRLKIISTGEIPQLFAEGIQIPLKEDQLIDDVWHGKFWESATGWHSLIIPSDSTVFNYYVSGQQEWSSLIHAHQMILNSNQHHSVSAEDHPTEKQIEEFPQIIFFIIFLIASGFLWLAPKV